MFDFSLSSSDYVEYLRLIADEITGLKEYISDLDAAVGDGDHWVNINMGFQKLMENAQELSALSVSDLFKRIGMLLMSTIGGSSGILYGGAYIAGAKALLGQQSIHGTNLCEALSAMSAAIMERGQSKPGYKTMVDAIEPAAQAYREGLKSNMELHELLKRVRQAALDGAQSTLDMEAVRGRAYYQANKGVGHLDPGAVTMAYQISGLMDFILTEGKIKKWR